nr:hypothetical protein [Planctomycetota bacterium]
MATPDSHPTAGLIESLSRREARLAVIGLGYVGLPLAVRFAACFPVIGFDTRAERLAQLREGRDDTGGVGREQLLASGLVPTGQAADLATARFVVV